jgi:hypothetical protein
MAAPPSPPHFRDKNEWSTLPETEIDRLQQRLYNNLKNMNIKMTKPERIKFVETLLEKQNYTCAFGKNVAGMYCWNEPKENYLDNVYEEKTYLKLQWSHIKPRCRKEKETIDNLYLLCARCNNQIQTSRYLEQLKAELMSKIEHIDMILTTSLLDTTV